MLEQLPPVDVLTTWLRRLVAEKGGLSWVEAGRSYILGGCLLRADRCLAEKAQCPGSSSGRVVHDVVYQSIRDSRAARLPGGRA